MIVKTFDSGWEQKGSVLAYPTGWQRPAKTEEWAYEQCIRDLPENRHVQMLSFPWATLIDVLRRRPKGAYPYLKALDLCPPRKTLVRATVCQHIYAKDLLQYFKHLGITDLFWSHAQNKETKIDGIRIHPFPLYPVRCFDSTRLECDRAKPLIERKYLCSFIGAYDSNLYLSPVRKWILDLPPRADVYAAMRSEWHYEKEVYGEQIQGISESDEQKAVKAHHANEYVAVLQETIFSLCPSGSGPNSIRLWESFGFGCIPVMLSDSFLTPVKSELWDKAVITVKETQDTVSDIISCLERVAKNPNQISQMSAAGREIWSSFIKNASVSYIAETMIKSLKMPLKMHQINT